jgi:hypothetical protein
MLAMSAQPRFRAIQLALLVGACLWPPATGAAQPDPRFELSWDVPLGCPDQEAAERALRDYLGERSAARKGSHATEVTVEIESLDHGRFHAHIDLDSDEGSGERTFEGQGCAHVAEAAILIVAMAIDPEGTAARLDQPSDRADVGQGATQANGPLRVALGLHLDGDLGSLPSPTVGAGPSLGLRLGRLQIDALGTAYLPQTTVRGPTAKGGGELWLYTAGIRACYSLLQDTRDGLGFGPCLGGDGGLVYGRGQGLARERSQSQFWGAAFIGLGMLEVVLQRWEFGLTAEAGLPLHRPRWVIDDFGEIFQTSAVVAKLSLHAAVLLP